MKGPFININNLNNIYTRNYKTLKSKRFNTRKDKICYDNEQVLSHFCYRNVDKGGKGLASNVFWVFFIGVWRRKQIFSRVWRLQRLRRRADFDNFLLASSVYKIKASAYFGHYNWRRASIKTR